MANFRIYPGMFLVVGRDAHGLSEGQIVQVLNCRYNLSFVGVHGHFPLDGVYLLPLNVATGTRVEDIGGYIPPIKK